MVYRGYRFKFHHIFPPMIVSREANSADPDEMLQYAAFHVGLQCLPVYERLIGITLLYSFGREYKILL